MNAFDIDRILKILPHKYPFLFVDKVVEVDPGKSLVAIKNVTINEPFFQGHFPDVPIMPGVLQIEAIAQAAGLMALSLLEEENKGKVEDYDTILMSVSNAKFRRIVKPGDQLRIKVSIASLKRFLAKIDGVITVDGQVATEASMMFMLSPKSARNNTTN